MCQIRAPAPACSVIISAHPLFYHVVHFIWCSEPFCYDTCWYGTYDIVTSPRFLSYFASITLQAVWKAFTPVRKAYLTHVLELLQSRLAEMSCKFKAAYWIFKFIYSRHRSINLFHSDVIFSVWKKIDKSMCEKLFSVQLSKTANVFTVCSKYNACHMHNTIQWIIGILAEMVWTVLFFLSTEDSLAFLIKRHSTIKQTNNSFPDRKNK